MKLLKNNWLWVFLWAAFIMWMPSGELAPPPIPTDFQTVKKGANYATPRQIKPRVAPDSVGWIIRFMPNCNYILNNVDGTVSVDQQDWNKTCGLMFHHFDPHVNTAMLGWRHNIEARKIEVNFYHHISKKRSYTPPLTAFDFSEPFEYRIVPRYSDGTITETLWTLDGKLIKCIQFDFPDLKAKWRVQTQEINFYFGGNQKAPQDVTVYKRLIKYY